MAVIYKSQYGSTKKYAEWISTEVYGDLFEASEIKPKDLVDYDTIVFGGGLYASGINGVSIITNNFEELRGKNLVIFTVGLASTEDTIIFNPIIKKNCTEEMRKSIRFFHLRGGIDYKRLNLIHKPMMAMLKAVTARKGTDKLSEDDKMMLATYGSKVDFTDRGTIAPLVDYVKAYCL